MNDLTITTDFTDIALPTDLAASQQLNRDLLTLVVALQARVKRLEAELTELKERLNDSSSNSSNPPSRSKR
ncbi:MAG: DUF6444 domain-containing protein [Candidatus Thiothrix putei]|uniref:DUF6444 domain-containing protein n=1 Tax=Candidatus Thiothrix putei TaxID=3080811 RepID=A0AA95HA43_9GAMM|nr:MAG: DUF6444 domain-containing protein [Candidatus Thiothrix putei]